MSSYLQKCPICRSLIDEEDLFCSNCGTEAPSSDQHNEQQHDEHQQSIYSFECDGCGASMSYDASAQNLRCPFCGSERLTQQKETRTLRPDGVVTFEFDAATADQLLREWLASSFWTASGAANESAVNQLTPVYVPFWIFTTQTSTRWTGDSSHTPIGARGDWYPMSGRHASQYKDLLVVASSILTAQEVQSISPFTSDKAIAPDQVDLKNIIVEEFRMPRKYARPQVRGLIKERERAACSKYIPGRQRNVHVNVQISDMSSRPILLPVWIMVYRFKDKPYRVLINAQTGKVAGQSPFAYGKLATIVIIVFIVIAAIIAIALISNMG